MRCPLLVLPPQESHQIPRLNACRVKGRDRAVGQEIFPKTLEVSVMGLVVPVQAVSMPRKPPKCLINARRSDWPAGTIGRGVKKSRCSRGVVNAGTWGEGP